MHIIAETAALKAAAQAAARAAMTRSTNPALGLVLLDASDRTEEFPGSLSLTSTDLAQTLRQTLTARVEEPGRRAVSAERLSAILGTLDAPTVAIRANGEHGISISAGRARFKVSGMDPDEFPGGHERAPGADAVRFTVEGGALAQLLGDVSGCASTEEGRADLNGVQAEVTGGDAPGETALTLVATDGSRLAASDCTVTDAEGVDSASATRLLPLDGLRTLAGLLKRQHGAWNAALGTRRAQFTGDGVSLSMSLVEGQFPPWRKILPGPHTHDKRATMPVAALLSAVKQAAIMAQDRNKTARLDFSADRLTITARGQDGGDVSAIAPCTMTGAESLLLGVNLGFLGEMLGAVKAGEVVLELGDALEPVIVRDPSRDGFLGVVMPMRLG